MESDLLKEIKETVCYSGKQLLAKGLVARTWGNVSMRVNENEMVITPSGRKYEELTPNDMVLVNFHDYSYKGSIKPSSELKLHCEIYRNRKEVNAVIHTHQMYASIVAAAQKDVVVLNENHQKILGAKVVKSAPYALPNTKKITKGTYNALGQNKAALMANHGVVCAGNDLEEVFEICETLEETCKMFIQSCGQTA